MMGCLIGGMGLESIVELTEALHFGDWWWEKRFCKSRIWPSEEFNKHYPRSSSIISRKYFVSRKCVTGVLAVGSRSLCTCKRECAKVWKRARVQESD